MKLCYSHSRCVLPNLFLYLAILLLLLLPACNSAPDSLEPRVDAPKDPKDGWYPRLFLTDKVFGDSFSDRIKQKLVPYLRSQVAWQRLLIARSDPGGRPHDGYSSLELLEDLDRVTFVDSELTFNCHVACQKKGLMCSKRWAFAINRCDIMKAAYPRSQSCITNFFGRDLPAFRPSDDRILLNDRVESWTPSCGASHDLTQRPCGCDPFPPSSATATFHTVMNCQATRYFDYQSRYSHFWFQQVKMPGKYTRLLSANGPDHLVKEVPTHIAPPHDMSKDSYTALNKPKSVDHWLQNAKDVGDIVVLLDPDCAMIQPMNIYVKQGYPIAQQGYYGFDNLEPRSLKIEFDICRHYCPECTFFDPIAVPIIIDRRDLAKIAPLWTKYTEAIRADKDKWNPAWNDSKEAVNAISWVAEMYALVPTNHRPAVSQRFHMYGYVLAAAKLNIRHEIWNLQTVPGSHTKYLGTAPLLHYHILVEMSNGSSWQKGRPGAGENYIWPVPEGTDQVSNNCANCHSNVTKCWYVVTCFCAMFEFRQPTGPSTYQWPANGGVYDSEPGT